MNRSARLIPFSMSLVGLLCDRLASTELLQATDDIVDAASTVRPPPEKMSRAADDSEMGEANISAEVGSNGEQDLVDEDLMQDERRRATGVCTPAS